MLSSNTLGEESTVKPVLIAELNFDTSLKIPFHRKVI